MILSRTLIGVGTAGVVVAGIALGDSRDFTPPAPVAATPANVAGTWSGPMTFIGAMPAASFAMSLTQAPGAATVAGTWEGKTGSGTVDGLVSSGTIFSGQLV